MHTNDEEILSHIFQPYLCYNQADEHILYLDSQTSVMLVNTWMLEYLQQ